MANFEFELQAVEPAKDAGRQAICALGELVPVSPSSIEVVLCTLFQHGITIESGEYRWLTPQEQAEGLGIEEEEVYAGPPTRTVMEAYPHLPKPDEVLALPPEPLT